MASRRPSTSAAAAPVTLTNSNSTPLANLIQPELPEEVILEILVRLPAKSLLRFRCVCKSWEASFRDPHFLKKHVNSAKLKILMTSRGKLLKSLPILTLCCDRSWAKAQNRSLPVPVRKPLQHVKVVGSCNGLVCLRVWGRDGTEKIYVWNPCTNESTKLPFTFSWKKFTNILGFGFDDSSNEFKLVRLFVDRFNYEIAEWDKVTYSAEVYGMWEGCRRRRIFDFPYGRHPATSSEGLFLNGAMHWIAAPVPVEDGNWVVVSLDLAKATVFQQLPLPEQCGGATADVSSVGGLLCVMSFDYGSHYDVWIMKDYGVKESWVKLLTIPFVTTSPTSIPHWWEWYPSNHLFSPTLSFLPISSPIHFSKINGHLLMLFHGKLVLYSSTEGTFQNVEIGRIFTCFDNPIYLTYVDSLFTPSLMMRSRGESSQV